MAITYSQHSNLTAADLHALTRWTVADTAARLALSLVDTDNDKLCKQLDNNSYWLLADWAGPTWVELTSAGVAAVTSVFGQIGDVDETDANFTASQIANVAAGNLAATDVQAALNELDGEKAGTVHAHVLSEISDSGTAAAEDVGTGIGDIPQLEDVGGGTPGLPAVDGSQLLGVAGGGSAITVEDDGTPLTTDVTKFNFAGAVTLTEPVADEITVTVTPGSAPVASVFTRTGAVLPEASDYNASQIDNDATNANGNVTGAYVSGALDTADTAIEANTTAAAAAQADADAAQSDASAAKAKTDFLTVTQTVNLDTVETATTDNAADISTNAAAIGLNTTHRGSDGSNHSKVTANESAIAALGTASAEDVGVTIGDVVQLENVGGSPGMPAVDGSQLTGLTSSGAIDVEEAGVPKVTDATTMNFTGGGVTVVDAGAGEATVTIAPGAAPIDTVFGRTGTVTAAASDYDASQVDNDSSVLGGTSTVAAALTQLDTDITNKTVDVVSNVASGVILGRDTAGSGNSEELTPAEARTLLGLPNTTTDDALARYDGVTGDQQDSPVTLADAGSMSWPGAVTVIDQTGLESNTVQAKEALRTWKDHVQYAVAAPTVVDVADRGVWWVDSGANPVEPKFRQDDGTDLNLKDGVDAKADLATHTTDQTYTHDEIDAAVDGLTNHVTDATNPHSTSLTNLVPGTHSDLENAAPDAGAIFASLQSGQFVTQAPFVQQTTVGSTDRIIIEESGGTKKWAEVGDLPQGMGNGDLLAANNLSDVADRETASQNILGTHSALEAAAPDAGSILCTSIAGNGQITGLTADASPAVDDVVMVEDAVSGAKVKVELQNLPDNSTDVTLTGTPDYITIAGQVITRNPIDLTSDVTGDLPVAEGGTGASTASAARGNLAVPNISTGGTSPVGVVTPGAVGDLYVDTTADIAYQAVGTTSADWDTTTGATGSGILTGTSNPPVNVTDFVAGEFYYVTTSQGLWYNDAGTPEEVGVIADGTSIEVDATNGLQLLGFDAALTDQIPKKNGSGDLEWGAVSRTPENKAPVRVATTQVSPPLRVLASDYANGSGIDDITLATGDRILIKDGVDTSIGNYSYDDLAGTPNANGEAEPVCPTLGTWTLDPFVTGPDANGEAKPDNTLIESTSEIIFYTHDAGGTDRSALLASLRYTDENVWDRIRMPSATFDVTSATDNGTSITLAVSHISGTGAWVGPTTEEVLASSPSRTTAINFFDSDEASADNTAVFEDLRADDIVQVGQFGTFYVSGAPVDNTTYWTVPVRFQPSYVIPWPSATQATKLTQHLFDGIYTVEASGAPSRASDYTIGTAVASSECMVQQGTENANRLFVCYNAAGSDVVGTDGLKIQPPRYDHYNATGFGGFRFALLEGANDSVNNGAFNGSATLDPCPVADAENTGLKFSGKPWTRSSNPGWGANQGLPLHVQGILHQSGGPGAHIILNQRDDPTKVAVFRNNLQSIPDFTSDYNDDTRFADLTLLGSTFEYWDPTTVYETTVIPQSPSCGYSGTGRFTIPDLTADRRWTWDDTTHVDPGWINHGLTSTTTLSYDYPGILMPNDGVVLSYTMQTYLQGQAGATVSWKAELTRVRPNEGASGSTNIDMVNTSLAGAQGAVEGEMNSVTVGKQINATLADGLTFADSTFKKGDKLIAALRLLGGTGTPDDMRIEWSLQVIFFDAPMLYEGKLDGPTV